MTATVLVLDGFGIGAMPDAGVMRAGDAAADTLGSIARWSVDSRRRQLAVPHLTGAGLGALRPDLLDAGLLPDAVSPVSATARRAALGYPGADTFAGHQTMMGADMSHVVLCRIGERLPELLEGLRRAGHTAELLDGRPLVVVDGAALVHDNLEADPGLNWNVSARLADLPWESIVSIAEVVRAIAPVARVIAVGGAVDRPLRDFVRDGSGSTLGLDTPASGFYRNGGLRVQHMGAAIRHDRQLPELVACTGQPVSLIGKAADILDTDTEVRRLPGVDTAAVLADTGRAMAERGLVVANVQQTDLAGHERDPGRFADLLEQVDRAVPDLLGRLHAADILVITGDHGNDPLIGHAFHTREYVPVLSLTAGRSAVSRAPDLDTLADLGASIAARLGLAADLIATGRATDLTPTQEER